MGKNSTNVSDPYEEILVYTDDSVVTNDLVLLTEGNRVLKLDDTVDLSQESNNTESLATITAAASYAAVNSVPIGSSFQCQLGDALVVVQSPALNSGIHIRKESLQGKTIIKARSVTAGTTFHIGVQKLSETRVAVVWGTTGNALYLRIYDENLDLVGSQQTVSSDSVTGYNNIDMAKLSNGNVIIGYRRNTGANISGKIFTPEAALVGSELTLTSDAGSSVAVTDLDAGGFALSWYLTTHKFQRFSSTGTTVGATISISGTTNEFSSGWSGLRITGLASDSLVVLGGDAAAKPTYYLYNSANTLIATLAINSMSTQYDHIPGLVRTELGFAVAVHTEADEVTIYQYNATGTLLSSSTIDFTTNWTTTPTSGGLMIREVPKKGFILMRVATTNQLGYGFVTYGDRTLGTVVEDTATVSVLYVDMWVTRTGVAILRYDKDSVGYVVRYNALRKNILGIALANAASNQVRVARKGSFTTTATYKSSFVFDGRSLAVAGPRGLVADNRVTLLGMES